MAQRSIRRRASSEAMFHLSRLIFELELTVVKSFALSLAVNLDPHISGDSAYCGIAEYITALRAFNEYNQATGSQYTSGHVGDVQ